MEKKPPRPMTPFDELVTSPWLQMMKLLLPYTPAPSQRMLATLIKFMELRQTIFLCSMPGGPSARFFQKNASSPPHDILNSLKPYLDPQDADMVDMIMNMKDMMDLAEMMNTEGNGTAHNPMDLMAGMMSPEQQEAFQTYSAMFSDISKNNTKGDDGHERMDEQPGSEKHRPDEAGTDQNGSIPYAGKDRP